MAKDEIISPEALYQSATKCRRGVGWKDSTAHFMLNALPEIGKLSERLQSGTYEPRPTRHMHITHPKERDVQSISFRDRVYQRSLADNAVYPAVAKSLIYDNLACQKGKGPDFGRARLKEHLRRYYRENGPDGWVLQFDVHHYFPCMRHDVAEEIFRPRLPAEVFEMVQAILHQQPGSMGYNPGSQMIQILGIAYLDRLDHIIKEQLRVKHYLRYMDDGILIHGDKALLERCMAEIKRELCRVGLQFNQKKTSIYPLRKGIRFLGFDFSLKRSGKVVMTLDPANIKDERRKLRRMAAKAKAGGMAKVKVDECFASWKNHAHKGNNYKAIRRMEMFYSDLWKGADGK